MNVHFRVDASREMGSGHVMRCLALGDELRRRGVRVQYICRRLEGDLVPLLEERRYRVDGLTEMKETGGRSGGHVDWRTDAGQTEAAVHRERGGAHWMVVDHYSLDEKWEKYIRGCVKQVMVIDDLADRSHDCDLLLNHNLHIDLRARYNGSVPPHCTLLLGPSFAPLRAEFEKMRKKSAARDGTIERIMVFFGGSDLSNETAKVLRTLSAIERPEVAVDVVVGINNPNAEEIRDLVSSSSRFSYHGGASTMSGLMAGADLFIGAGGVTVWERCCLGLPSLVITVAQNQVGPVRHLAERKLLYYLGESSHVSQPDIARALDYCFAHPQELRRFSRAAYDLVDGLGTVRVADEIMRGRH